MSENQQFTEVSVDRREETVTNQQPGYSSSERVTRDVAAEQRLNFFQIKRVLYTVLGILQITLGLRFALKLMAANPDSGFSQFIYGITGPFSAPFTGLVATPAAKGSVLEVTTLIAMAVYALLFWIVMRVILIAIDRPSARTLTRSVREETAGGTARTTHTIQG